MQVETASEGARAGASSTRSNEPLARWGIRLVASIIATTIAMLVATVILGWLVGRVVNDRFSWSQWLWWIPTPVALAAGLLGLLASLRPAPKARTRRRRVWRWLTGIVAILAYFLFIEHRFHRLLSSDQTNATAAIDLTVTHWNMGPETWDVQKKYFDALKPIAGDVTIITNPGGTFGTDFAQPWMQTRGLAVHHVGPLAILTAIPIRTMRVLVAAERSWIVLLELDTTEQLGRPIVMYCIDLPSNPRTPRMALARKLRAMLDQSGAPAPDIVVGDFNIPRRSASISVLFPHMHYAFNEAGAGCGASFHRSLPLYHIDQMLANPDIQFQDYNLHDLGLGRHRAQSGRIAAAR